MNSKVVFFLFFLGLSLTQAVPTNINEKSLDEGHNLKIDKTEEDDQARSKKSVICLDSGSMVPQAQSYSIQAAPQPVQTLNIQQVPQRVQTLNIQAVPQPVQTFSIQPAPQPVQTFNVIQPPAQTSLKFIQPPQPCPPSQTNVNIIQPPKEEKPVKPVVETIIKEKVVKPEPKPEKIVAPKIEKEPVRPVYEGQMMVVPPKPVMMITEPEPVATYVKVPQCQQCQQSIMQCSCTKQQVPTLGSAVFMEPAMRIYKERSMDRHMVPMSHRLHHHVS